MSSDQSSAHPDKIAQPPGSTLSADAAPAGAPAQADSALGGQSPQARLRDLLARLDAALAPALSSDAVEDAREFAEQLVEQATRPSPNPVAVRYSADMLRLAAQSFASGLPEAAQIAAELAAMAQALP